MNTNPTVTGRKAASIDEFCHQHSISRAFFYKLQKLGQAPATMQVGARQLISEESAAEWRRARTVAAAPPST